MIEDFYFHADRSSGFEIRAASLSTPLNDVLVYGKEAQQILSHYQDLPGIDVSHYIREDWEDDTSTLDLEIFICKQYLFAGVLTNQGNHKIPIWSFINNLLKFWEEGATPQDHADKEDNVIGLSIARKDEITGNRSVAVKFTGNPNICQLPFRVITRVKHILEKAPHLKCIRIFPEDSNCDIELAFDKYELNKKLCLDEHAKIDDALTLLEGMNLSKYK